jgi:hypothetical protein
MNMRGAAGANALRLVQKVYGAAFQSIPFRARMPTY